MTIALETLPDELLELVFERLAAPAPDDDEWPNFPSSGCHVRQHCLERLEPALLSLSLASKRFHSIGQRFLPRVKSVQEYWSDDISGWAQWAGYCVYIARDTFYAYTSYWERQHMASWTPSLMDNITDLAITLDSTANAGHFAGAFHKFGHLAHLNLEIYSNEADASDVAVHHAFYTGVQSLSEPYPRLRSFRYITYDVDDYLQVVIAFVHRYRVGRLQLDCPGRLGSVSHTMPLPYLQHLSVIAHAETAGSAIPSVLRRSPNLLGVWVVTLHTEQTRMWYDLPASVATIGVWDLNSLLYLHDTLRDGRELPNLRFVETPRMRVDLDKIRHPTVSTLEEVLQAADAMDKLLYTRGGSIQPTGWRENLEASAIANELHATGFAQDLETM